MNCNAGELTRGQAGSREHEGDCVSADDATRLTLDVGKVEGEGSECADVLCGLEALEAQAGVGVCSEGADATSGQTGGAVEGDIAAVQLHGVAGVHGDGDSDLIGAAVGNGDGPNSASDPQVVRGQ